VTRESQNYTKWVVASFVVILLTQNFLTNYLHVGRPGTFDSFQMDSEQSVRLMVEKTAHDGLASTGGLLLCRDINAAPYYSAWGLQGKIACLGYAIIGGEFSDYFYLCELITAIMLALTITLFGVFCWHEWGLTSAITLWVLVSISDWLIFAGRNTYLVYWLHLLPFVLAFVLFPPKISNVNYYLIIGSVVLVKSLCYLDYSSNIVLSTAAAPLYFGITKGWRLKRIVTSMFAIVGVSTIAVLAAIIVTGIQSGIYLGSITDGFSQLLTSAGSRMYGVSDVSKAANPSISTMQILDTYLMLPVISIPNDAPCRYRVYLSFFSSIALLLPLSLYGMITKFSGDAKVIEALSLTAIWGLISTLSWALIMKGHMAHHVHMNGMIFYLPYLLLLYPLIGKCLSTLRSPNINA
jgi:hypothetical protein